MTANAIPSQSILLVGDDSGIADSLALSVGDDFVVVRSTDAFTALEHLKTNPPPSVIVLDFALPVLEGLGFRRTQKNDPEIAAIPVVLLTAHANDERVRKFGADAYVTKPVDLALLVQTIVGLARVS
ncbi:MAG: response regulator [Thermoanaerobaculia bacterium]